MTGGQILLNLLFAALAFFLTRWIVGIFAPEDNGRGDREKAILALALLVAVVVFFLNFAAQIIKPVAGV